MNIKISENNRRTWKNKTTRQKRINGIIKSRWNNINQEEYYKERIKPLIYEGVTFARMCRIYKLDKSAPTLRKLMLKYGVTDDIIKAQQNVSDGKRQGGLSQKGKHSPFKGKTYSEIFGSDEKAKQRAKITSDWMKIRNIRRFATKISKPQKMLFEIIQKTFKTAVLEYEVQINKRKIYLDIAVPELKLNFEYDGLHWHKHKKNIKYNDEQRDRELSKLGWKIFRIGFYENPTATQLEERLKGLNIC